MPYSYDYRQPVTTIQLRLALATNLAALTPVTVAFAGATLLGNEQILLAGQTDTTQNGIYVLLNTGSQVAVGGNYDGSGHKAVTVTAGRFYFPDLGNATSVTNGTITLSQADIDAGKGLSGGAGTITFNGANGVACTAALFEAKLEKDTEVLGGGSLPFDYVAYITAGTNAGKRYQLEDVPTPHLVGTAMVYFLLPRAPLTEYLWRAPATIAPTPTVFTDDNPLPAPTGGDPVTSAPPQETVKASTARTGTVKTDVTQTDPVVVTLVTFNALAARVDALENAGPLGTTEDLGELVNGAIRTGYTLVLNSDGSGLPKQIWYWDGASAAADDGVQVLQASGHNGNGRYVLQVAI